MSAGRRAGDSAGTGTGTAAMADVRAALAAHRAQRIAGDRRAAVAMVLREAASGFDVLFIERARRLGDPWSGHMAFPGGRVDPADADERAAAERETLEEVGLDLAAAEHLGRLDDVRAGIPLLRPLVLSAFVYRTEGSPGLRPNHEVRAALWVPFAACLERERHTGYGFGPVRLPGVCVGEPERQIVWGLTYELLRSFCAAIGTPFGRRS